MTIRPVANHVALTLGLDGDGTSDAGGGDAVGATVGTGVGDSGGRDGVDVRLGAGLTADEQATSTDTRTAADSER